MKHYQIDITECSQTALDFNKQLMIFISIKYISFFMYGAPPSQKYFFTMNNLFMCYATRVRLIVGW